jgi:hypothetical protein
MVTLLNGQSFLSTSKPPAGEAYLPSIDRPPDQGLHIRRQHARSHLQATVDPDARQIRQIGEPELGLKARTILRLGSPHGRGTQSI